MTHDEALKRAREIFHTACGEGRLMGDVLADALERVQRETAEKCAEIAANADMPEGMALQFRMLCKCSIVSEIRAAFGIEGSGAEARRERR